jgi:hypothetical protein
MLEGGELDFLIAPEYLAAVHPTEVLFEDSHTCLAWSRNRRPASIRQAARLRSRRRMTA